MFAIEPVPMQIRILLSLVAVTVSASGAALNTERIDQLTGLKGKLNDKEGVYKSVSPVLTSPFPSTTGKCRPLRD